MKTITKPVAREIIDDFADEIQSRKFPGPKPAKTVIDFRTDRKDGRERDILYVPIDLLRYRKDNGRISSDVLHYERACGKLVETDEKAQKQIEEFLRAKDETKTKELLALIGNEGQRDPAIITCDGFLINGNRRKMVMEELHHKHPEDERFKYMKVVILPGRDSKDDGGPPTLLEIEEIENRYQLQSEGKAEYYQFDKALSMRRKIDFGMSLEQQLRDDPRYKGLDKNEFNKALKEAKESFLKPLECIDRYLEYLGRGGLYGTVSTGVGDREGRWQAFLDYYKSVYCKLENDRKRIQLGIAEDQIGEVEDIAFKIIRVRELAGLPKVHKIMRDLPKWLSRYDARKELFKLAEVALDLPEEKKCGSDGKEYDARTIDKLWAGTYADKIAKQVKKAQEYYQYKKGQDTPLTLLEAALAKINHESMDPHALNVADISRAKQFVQQIRQRLNGLQSELYHCEKGWKEFEQKHGN
jgi:hypothetical protein